MLAFDRYAFDLSQFAGGPQVVKYSIRARSFWQLQFPAPTDQFYIEKPGPFRAVLPDRRRTCCSYIPLGCSVYLGFSRPSATGSRGCRY